MQRVDDDLHDLDGSLRPDPEHPSAREIQLGLIGRQVGLVGQVRLVGRVGQAALRWGAIVLYAGAVCLAQPALRAGKTKSGIAYDVQGKGPVVVLITGSNLDRRMWTREAEWLAPDHTVIRYDLRAHGQSDSATTASRTWTIC